MDGWDTLRARASGMLQGTQRILDEGGDPVAVDGVRDAIHAILDVCRAQCAAAEPHSPTFPTNGHEGETPLGQQIDPIIARLHETGRIDSPQDMLPVHPFMPPHLLEAYFANQPRETE